MGGVSQPEVGQPEVCQPEVGRGANLKWVEEANLK